MYEWNNNLNDFLAGLQLAFTAAQTFGGIASTVSSLSRARIFSHSSVGHGEAGMASSVHGNGCVGAWL